MTDLIQYLKEFGKTSLTEKKLNEIDCLILVQLLYMDFEKLDLKKGINYSFGDLMDQENYISLFDNPTYGKTYQDLYKLVWLSNRFKDLTISDFEQVKKVEEEIQFAAITYHIQDMSIVAFRGTDSSIVGWKEDLNIVYLDRLPSQKLAKDYLTRVALNLKGKLYIAGHSKGGTLACFAASKTLRSIQCRIKKIYCYDNPGFQKDLYSSIGYKIIRSKIVKFVPEQTVFGLLMSQHRDYKVVKSHVKGIIQHDPLTWIIEDGEFVYEDEISSKSERLISHMNQWLEETSNEKKKQFIETIYSFFTSTEANQVDEALEDKFGFIRNSFTQFQSISKEEKENVVHLILNLHTKFMKDHLKLQK